MDIPDFTVSFKCLFCGEALEGPEDAEYQSGDLIKCTKCGEENDYDSVFEVAKEEGMSQVKEKVEEQFQKQFKGLFKK
jgi:DNA-directed RNA polymerase subunit RPC12/RpoP